jgi:hypothetical protein
VPAANVSAPGGVISLSDSKSPASGAGAGPMTVGSAVPPSSTAGSRTAPSPSHHPQLPHPPASAAEPLPPSSVVANRASEPMRRPYPVRSGSDHYPTLDAALQRIGELEDENRSLRYDLGRTRAAPPSVSSVVDSALAAFNSYERDLDIRSRDARDIFVRTLSGLVGHPRGRDRDVLSSAIIPAGERDWRSSPSDVSKVPSIF